MGRSFQHSKLDSPRIWRQPALHFILIAIAVLALDALGVEKGDGRSDSPAVDEARVLAELRSDFAAAQGRPMSDEEEAVALEQHRYETLLFEAGVDAGLHQTDPIVRRRLVQRMRFLVERMVVVPRPTDEQLLDLVAAHPTRFPQVHTLTFEHRYFARRVHGGETDASARSALSVLERGGDVEGDPFPRRLQTRRVDVSDIARVMGPAAAASIADAKPDVWVGPIASAYGAHLVRVRESVVRDPELAEVRRRAMALWKQRIRDKQGHAIARSITEAR